MAEKKITKREVVGMMLAEEVIKANPIYLSYLENELNLLDKKASNKKATANQVANIGIKDTIIATLGGNEPMTVTELQKANEELGLLSNQKVSSMLRQLVEDGTVIKSTDKKTSRFSLA